MSYAIGMQTLRLEMAERIAHTDYNDNYALVRALTGKDPLLDPSANQAFNQAWEMDFLWHTNDGAVPWSARGRATDMGHAEFMEDGIDRRDTIYCPFHAVEEVLAFDAVQEYGLPDMDELVMYYEDLYQHEQAANPEQVFTGGYYKTIVSGAIDAFGWDMLLLAAADRKRFDRVLEGFFRQTLHHVTAWSKTSIKVFIQHDDMVWSSGAFMSPRFYREAIFPRYQKLWQVLHDAGKQVLFCSDGNFTQFVDDIAAAGADGFIFEPMTDLDYVVQKYGQTKVIMGSKLDCRTLTFGSREEIKREIDDTIKIARLCPGFFFAVGNHLPSNIPVDNALYYLDYLRENWRR
jgi:hypothetical protein